MAKATAASGCGTREISAKGNEDEIVARRRRERRPDLRDKASTRLHGRTELQTSEPHRGCGGKRRSRSKAGGTYGLLLPWHQMSVKV